MLDLAIVELPYIDDKRIKQLYSIASSHLQVNIMCTSLIQT